MKVHEEKSAQNHVWPDQTYHQEREDKIGKVPFGRLIHVNFTQLVDIIVLIREALLSYQSRLPTIMKKD